MIPDTGAASSKHPAHQWLPRRKTPQSSPDDRSPAPVCILESRAGDRARDRYATRRRPLSRLAARKSAVAGGHPDEHEDERDDEPSAKASQSSRDHGHFILHRLKMLARAHPHVNQVGNRRSSGQCGVRGRRRVRVRTDLNPLVTIHLLSGAGAAVRAFHHPRALRQCARTQETIRGAVMGLQRRPARTHFPSREWAPLARPRSNHVPRRGLHAPRGSRSAHRLCARW